MSKPSVKSRVPVWGQWVCVGKPSRWLFTAAMTTLPASKPGLPIALTTTSPVEVSQKSRQPGLAAGATGMSTNRILVHLHSAETRRKQARAAIMQRLEAIELASAGMLEFCLNDEGL